MQGKAPVEVMENLESVEDIEGDNFGIPGLDHSRLISAGSSFSDLL